MAKLWGARFEGGPAPELAALSRSTHFDWVLAPYDIAGSHAHAKALAAAGHLTAAEEAAMHDGLDVLAARVESGELVATDDDEDVHGALEAALVTVVGPELGGKLRAGRSRNDQIATLIRMFLLDHATVIERHVVRLIDAIAAQASAHPDAVMPGRTHLQHAQPILLAHHLLAHAWPLVRDLERLRDWRGRAQASPYGAGALAGGALGLDPTIVARELNLGDPLPNSIDATSARDVVAEFAYVAAQIGVDLSRFAEDIILWTTREFGFARLDDAYSTGSSIMPQKKNPDIAELARGKAGRLVGNLTGTADDAQGSPARVQPRPAGRQGAGLRFGRDARARAARIRRHGRDADLRRAERMRDLASAGFSLATDVADHLVRQGVPFREAHEIAGALVRFCEEHDLELHEPSDADYAAIDPRLTGDVRAVLTVDGSIAVTHRCRRHGTRARRRATRGAHRSRTCPDRAAQNSPEKETR